MNGQGFQRLPSHVEERRFGDCGTYFFLFSFEVVKIKCAVLVPLSRFGGDRLDDLDHGLAAELISAIGPHFCSALAMACCTASLVGIESPIVSSE